MKKLKKQSGKPGPQPLELKRHYTTLSQKETQDVVEAVADLIVTFAKKGTPDTKEPETANRSLSGTNKANSEKSRGSTAPEKKETDPERTEGA